MSIYLVPIKVIIYTSHMINHNAIPTVTYLFCRYKPQKEKREKNINKLTERKHLFNTAFLLLILLNSII